MANTYGADHENVKFMVECYNREVQGLDDVEIWIHTCWGNPNMQRVMDDTSYAASFELYLNELRGDVWTIETKDRDFRDVELFGRSEGTAAEENLHSARSAIERCKPIAPRMSPRRSGAPSSTSPRNN